jgi:hypothetical protein
MLEEDTKTNKNAPTNNDTLETIDVNIRSVKKETWVRLRARAVLRGMHMAEYFDYLLSLSDKDSSTFKE